MNEFLIPEIRQAFPTDSCEVAPLIVQAMEDLACTFVNSKDSKKAYPLFEYFFEQPANQYSFENALLYEVNGKIAGSIIGYDGSLLAKYREPFLVYIAEKYNVRNLKIDDETLKGEFYIDTISVYSKCQGQGIGKKLLRAIQIKAKNEGHKKIGLLVDLKNPKAKKLYSALGFKSIGSKQLGDGVYEHLQLNL